MYLIICLHHGYLFALVLSFNFICFVLCIPYGCLQKNFLLSFCLIFSVKHVDRNKRQSNNFHFVLPVKMYQSQEVRELMSVTFGRFGSPSLRCLTLLCRWCPHGLVGGQKRGEAHLLGGLPAWGAAVLLQFGGELHRHELLLQLRR